MSHGGVSTSFKGDVSPISSPQKHGEWKDGAKIVDPGVNALLKSTGALTAGEYNFQFWLSCTVEALFEVRLRNAADNSTLFSHEISIPAKLHVDIMIIPHLKFSEGEQVKVKNVSAITGVSQAAILVSEVVG